MLNLLKMGICDISMHSQGWQLRPCTYQEGIDQNSVSMLGYRLEEAEDDNITSLVIRGIPNQYGEYLQEGLLHFFYPENPLFGELLRFLFDIYRQVVSSVMQTQIPEVLVARETAVSRPDPRQRICHGMAALHGSFHKAWYAREVCRRLWGGLQGGGTTLSFHKAIYMINLKILENASALAMYRTRWEAAIQSAEL